ncbi:hypothetical protein A0Z48_08495 [Campylobacter jejuni]|nr:hypothetical protein [Campylobacter jejuni]EAI3890870.1 hypothetical protein [Campylobacter jejuni]EAI4349675.1 hypothetical protein [Campylobacter jejuni]EAI4351068.1 hypothetical protein [Campylobacter jejuni]
MKKIFLFCIFYTTVIFANPMPFGLELGKANFDEVVKKYPNFSNAGTSIYTGGKIIEVSSSDFELEGLKDKVLFIFDKENRLTLVQLKFHKDRFNDILYSLSKYKIIKKEVPYVGNRYVKLQDGDCKIELESPHLSFEMYLTYKTNQFEKLYKDYIKKEEQERKNKQNSIL